MKCRNRKKEYIKLHWFDWKISTLVLYIITFMYSFVRHRIWVDTYDVETTVLNVLPIFMFILSIILQIRPTKIVHPTNKKCTSDLQKEYIQPTKSLHLIPYKNSISDLQRVYIWPTKSVHPTYKKCKPY